jgi:hypothetical protein
MKFSGASNLAQEHFTRALVLAPPGSAAETRALAASSIFAISGRSSYLTRALEMMESSSQSVAPTVGGRPPYFIDSSTPVSAREDIMSCLHCAKTLQILDSEGDAGKAATFLSSQSIDATRTNLLTQAASKHLLWRLPVEPSPMSLGEEVRTLSSGMICKADVQSSMEKMSRRSSNASHDTGYESQDESISSWGFEQDSRLGVNIPPTYCSN